MLHKYAYLYIVVLLTYLHPTEIRQAQVIKQDNNAQINK